VIEPDQHVRATVVDLIGGDDARVTTPPPARRVAAVNAGESRSTSS
jgi:hypothetical protein